MWRCPVSSRLLLLPLINDNAAFLHTTLCSVAAVGRVVEEWTLAWQQEERPFRTRLDFGAVYKRMVSPLVSMSRYELLNFLMSSNSSFAWNHRPTPLHTGLWPDCEEWHVCKFSIGTATMGLGSWIFAAQHPSRTLWTHPAFNLYREAIKLLLLLASPHVLRMASVTLAITSDCSV